MRIRDLENKVTEIGKSYKELKEENLLLSQQVHDLFVKKLVFIWKELMLSNK